MPPRKEPTMEEYAGRFANRLKKLRDKAGLTVPDVLKSMDQKGYSIKEGAYYSWERGRSAPPLNAFPPLAKTLKVKIPELLPPR